jgi:chloramphenicol-sensitive protein RarD
MPAPPHSLRSGLAYAFIAYFTWGCFPLYFKLLDGVTAQHILCLRIFWSVLFLIPALTLTGLWGEVRQAIANRRVFGELIVAGLLLAINWYTFVYAVGIKEVMESSLAYFITPLVSVALGVVVLKERLRPAQILALALCVAGVAILTFATHRIPVLALTMAVSFALYGYMRKLAHAAPLVGLFVEMILLFPLAVVGMLCWTAPSLPQAYPGLANTPIAGPVFRALLLASVGVVTVVPLFWFVTATKRLPLVMIGLMQYLTPSISFVLALLLFHEDFTRARQWAFPMIWVALAVFSLDSIRAGQAPEVEAEP